MGWPHYVPLFAIGKVGNKMALPLAPMCLCGKLKFGESERAIVQESKDQKSNDESHNSNCFPISDEPFTIAHSPFTNLNRPFANRSILIMIIQIILQLQFKRRLKLVA